MKKIAHFGAFDHDSYGDILFPYIAEHYLPEFSITHVAPTGMPTSWPDAKPIISVQEAISRTDWDGILIGGGDIIQAGDWSTQKWEQGVDIPFCGLPSLWIGASFLSAKLNIPIAWNAPGVPAPFSDNFSETVRMVLEIGDYVSVRDLMSSSNLATHTEKSITVVTDSALAIREIWPQGEKRSHIVLSFSRNDLLTIPDEIRLAIGHMQRHLKLESADIIALPLMPWEFDNGNFEAAVLHIGLDVRVVQRCASLKDIACMIGTSTGYIGNSLHGLITALAYEVPAVLVLPSQNKSSHKYVGFLEAAGYSVAEHFATTWDSAQKKLTQQNYAKTRSKNSEWLDNHWAKIRAVLSASATDKSELWSKIVFAAHKESEYMSLLGLTPKNFCNESKKKFAALSSCIIGRDGQIASLDQAVAERDGQIASLNQAVAERDGQIASINQTVAERDGQIANLDQAVVERDRQIANLNQTVNDIFNSKSWRWMRPARYIDSQLKRLLSSYHPMATGGLHARLLHHGERLYWRLPAQYRDPLLHWCYRILGSLFKGMPHYERWKSAGSYNSSSSQCANVNQAGKDVFGYIVHDPFVTVIAVNYNGAQDLPEFLRALSLQSYRNFELIIVDNGSSDNSEEIVKRQHPLPFRINFICAGKNLGFAEGNNFALDYAKGEFIALLNVDTKAHEDWLRELVEALRCDGAAAAATSKLLFWSRFQYLVIESDAKIGIELKTLEDSLSYKKYFVRSGFLESGQIVCNKNGQLVLSLPIQDDFILIKVIPLESVDGYVRFNIKNKQLLQIPLSECHEIISIDFSLASAPNAGFIINNAGSTTAGNGMPCDRGFGEYDYGQYDSKCYVPYFCGCSVLIRRAAILERPIFIPEFFAYYEDSELSRWLIGSGYHILYAPRSVVFHRHSATSKEGSPLWKLLVRRSFSIFSYDGNVSLLTKNLDMAEREFGPYITPELGRILSNYDESIIRKLSAGSSFDKQKPIGIYNSHWNTRGGGESHALSIASELQKFGPVELISETDFDLEAIAQYFSLDLSNCRKLVLPRVTAEFTKKFFLFVNSTFGSNLPSQAINSWYLVSFPQRFVQEDVSRFYYFLFNSNYTRKWTHHYWGDHINGEVIYPVRMFRLTHETATQEPSKNARKKMILSVGRFFPFDHCKNQLVIAEAFQLLVSRIPEAGEWKLVLAGSLDTKYPNHVAYYNAVQDKLRGLNAELLPNLKHELLNELYSDAAIYVHATGMGQDPEKFPENFEHFGITPLEAMVAGAIPVVFSIGGPAEVINLLDVGYKFSSTESLVEVLSRLICQDMDELLAESAVVSMRAVKFVNAEATKKLPSLTCTPHALEAGSGT